jgi:hypothetical protein
MHRLPRVPPSPKIGAILIDLVSWAADLGIALTHECPEDRAAIEEVRDYACAWLTGAPCAEVPIADVLTTAATLLSAIDLGVRRGSRGPQRNAQRRAARAVAALVAA